MTLTGEAKSPGGKLARAQLTIDDHALSGVRVSGDFFVDPEPAARPTLDAIDAALTGAPADSTALALAARVRAAVPFGVELVGTSPEAVALAVRRAVAGDPELGAGDRPGPARIGQFSPDDIRRLTRGWAELPWRVAPEVPRGAALNVALDEVVSDRVGAGLAPPTLRFWGWAEPAVVIGRTQSLANEVDTDAARQMGVTVVRRMTGGGAMFLQPQGAVTYSLVIPDRQLMGLSVRASYEVCEAWVIAGLRAMGVDAHHVPINDIACSEGKIGGAAQARRRGVVLHHTTIAYDMDPDEMVRVLRIGREKLRDRGTASAEKRVSPLARQTGVGRAEVAARLQAHFLATFGGTVSVITPEESAEAEALVAAKYATRAWTEEFP